MPTAYKEHTFDSYDQCFRLYADTSVSHLEQCILCLQNLILYLTTIKLIYLPKNISNSTDNKDEIVTNCNVSQFHQNCIKLICNSTFNLPISKLSSKDSFNGHASLKLITSFLLAINIFKIFMSQIWIQSYLIQSIQIPEMILASTSFANKLELCWRSP